MARAHFFRYAPRCSDVILYKADFPSLSQSQSFIDTPLAFSPSRCSRT